VKVQEGPDLQAKTSYNIEGDEGLAGVGVGGGGGGGWGGVHLGPMKSLHEGGKSRAKQVVGSVRRRGNTQKEPELKNK